MVKSKIIELLEQGSTIDEIIVSLIQTLDEALSLKLDNSIDGDKGVSVTLIKLIDEVKSVAEQHRLGVHIEAPCIESEFSSIEPIDNDFFADNESDLDEVFNQAMLEEELEQEILVVEREERNGSRDANERNEYLRDISSAYDDFELTSRPENATFALFVSTRLN